MDGERGRFWLTFDLSARVHVIINDGWEIHVPLSKLEWEGCGTVEGGRKGVRAKYLHVAVILHLLMAVRSGFVIVS